MKFIVVSEFGEIMDLALHLKNIEKQDVVLCVTNPDDKKVGENLLPLDRHWWQYIGKKYIWIFDGCNAGNLEDWLKKQGEKVVNGTEVTDELENNRQMGQRWFKAAGFTQPFSKNFKGKTAFDQAIKYIQESNKKPLSN